MLRNPPTFTPMQGTDLTIRKTYEFLPPAAIFTQLFSSAVILGTREELSHIDVQYMTQSTAKKKNRKDTVGWMKISRTRK